MDPDRASVAGIERLIRRHLRRTPVVELNLDLRIGQTMRTIEVFSML